jgi:hypothetical protein
MICTRSIVYKYVAAIVFVSFAKLNLEATPRLARLLAMPGNSG